MVWSFAELGGEGWKRKRVGKVTSFVLDVLNLKNLLKGNMMSSQV